MKSYDGCWTCRLRRKKCDEERPVCKGCSTLQITCYFTDDKPTWMDGGAAQKDKADDVKREVRDAAARRRGTHLVDSDSDTEMATREMPSRPEDQTPSSSSSGIYFTLPAPQETWNVLEGLFAESHEPDQEADRRAVVFYFDHFFPFLFPFYRPPLLQGGRTWVMELMARNKAMWHTTLCLGSYFVSVALDNAAFGHEFCKNLAWDKLLRQTDVTFRMLQSQVQQVTSNDMQNLTVEKARSMGSVIQIQRFESSVGNFDNCQTHLSAAIELFRQICCAAGETAGGSKNGEPPFYGVLSRMGTPPWTLKGELNQAWSSDQAAFRFFSALLLVDDIISSTCLNEPPRLIEYHTQLLTNNSNQDRQPPLKLEEFVGCENWVLLNIGETAALNAWEKSLKRSGQLDIMELVARASALQQSLTDNLVLLDAAGNTSKMASPLDPFSFYNDQIPSIPGGTSALVTRIWAHAALLYLSIVVSGWQPGSPSIRENVVRVLQLLDQMPTPALLRTTVWPLCVVGCLAQPSEECLIRSIIEAMVPSRLFGPARKALEIMEYTWKCRDSLSVDSWDLAECVRSVGHMALLV